MGVDGVEVRVINQPAGVRVQGFYDMTVMDAWQFSLFTLILLFHPIHPRTTH